MTTSRAASDMNRPVAATEVSHSRRVHEPAVRARRASMKATTPIERTAATFSGRVNWFQPVLTIV